MNGNRISWTEKPAVVLGVMCGATFFIGKMALPGMMSWFDDFTTTHEQTTIDAPPPTGRVDRYAALVTGTAESDFSIEGRKGCSGALGPIPDIGEAAVSTQWHAVATVANKIGNFTVNASPDRSRVDITLERFPELESGLQLDKSSLDTDEPGVGTCEGQDIVDLTLASMHASQAVADTIDACIVQEESFQQGLSDQLRVFGETTYPEAAGNVHVQIPPEPSSFDSTQSRTALVELRADFEERGISIQAQHIEDCDFREFTMTPIVVPIVGTNNG